MGPPYSILGALMLILSFCGAEIKLFPVGKEIIYKWTTHMSSGTILPTELGSSWNMSLYIILQQPENNVTLIKLMDEENDIGVLGLPFKVYYSTGVLSGMAVDPSDEVWSVNIKRALSSLLQLQLDKIDSPSFITNEIGLHGNCKAEYSIQHKSSTSLTIHKMIDVDTCWNRPIERTANFPVFLCPTTYQDIESVDSERIYTINPMNEVLIQKIKATGVVLDQPYQAKAEAHYSKLRQRITFINVSSIHSPQLWHPMNEDPEEIDLIYEKVNLDPTFGKPLTNHTALIENVHGLMGEISDSLSTWEVGVKGLDNQTAFHLIDLMWWLHLDDWELLYQNVTLGTSYRQETIQHLFWEMVPQVGSEESTLFIKNLIKTGRIQGSMATRLLAHFPFYIRETSEELLAQCEELLRLEENVNKDIKKAAILSFATLIRKTCVTNCKTETLDRYAKMYLDQFTESREYDSQMAYLQGLANMELSQVLDFLIPVITGQETTSRHLRFLASWATLHTVLTDSNKIFSVFWSIFIDRNESLEMRVSALTLLIMSKPSASRFLSIYWYMQSEPSQQLYNFYYTTIHSLASSNYPCYRSLSEGANKLVRYVTAKSRQWATGNYILDFEDTDRAFGGLLQILLIASENTGLPNVFIFMSDQHALGHSRQFALYLKVEGLNAALTEELHKASGLENMELSQVFLLLQKLKIPLQSDEEIHLELIFKVNSQTVYSNYLNRTTFTEWSNEVRRVSSLYLEFSVNHQSLSVGGPNLAWSRPSDLGTPIIFLVRSSSLVSARGSISQDSQGRARNAQLDIRYSWNGVTSLRVYDPLKNQWHGADRSRNLHIRLPFATRLNLHFAKSFFNVTAVRHKDFVPGSRLGLVWHSSTRLVSTTSLPKQYPNISDDWSMDSEDLGARLGASVFDCGRDTLTEALYLLKSAFMINHKNYHMVPGGVVLLALLSMKDQLHFQPTGSNCGIMLYFSPLITPVEPVLEVGGNGIKVSMSRDDGVVWEIVAGSRKLHNANKELSFKLYRTPRVSSEGTWRVLQLEGAFVAPSRDALPPALAVSGYAFLAWGDGPAHTDRAAILDLKVTPGYPAMTPQPCTDLVPTCLQAASDLAATQTAKLRYSNLPGWLKMAAHALFPEHIQTESTQTQITFAYPVALLPWNTKGLCAVNGGSVLTLDNATISTSLSECYSLAVADCSHKARFAILVNRKNSILGAKVYCGSEVVTLEPSEGGISSVYINGTKLSNLTHEEQNVDPDKYELNVSRTSDGVVEVELRSGVVLRHYNSTIVLLIPGTFRGYTCGICGDFNGDTSNEPSLSYTQC